ncbi:hypothetical protein LS73_001905 [Helicobacter muridarum]|uniref:Uncharacterized protein n=1 Tax=Helicobacter muridarum TaxID=216 RepID=A0A099TXH7_9HELI|nr:hypothetical protein [Helicobacter muridarum]TLE01447.1 hypothetical protein LS73_001905 [Helicobacter muridarum]STQ85389.1 Uncharacterised protein [Helicobacter muridarum]
MDKLLEQHLYIKNITRILQKTANPIKQLLLVNKRLNKILCVFVFLIIMGENLKAEQRNGLIGRAGIGANYISHKVKTTTISGVLMSADVNIGWIWRDYAKILLFGSIGYGPNDIKGDYLINGGKKLTKLTYTGGAFVNVRYGFKVGYNLSSIFQAWDHAIYINAGIDALGLSNSQISTPYSVSLYTQNYFIELDGRKVLGEKLSIEYLGNFRISNATVSLITNKEDIVQTNGLDSRNISSYGFQVGIGLNYKFSKKAYFFTNLHFEYQFINKAQPKTISTLANPASNGLNANATDTVQYLDNSTMYTRLQFGFGF